MTSSGHGRFILTAALLLGTLGCPVWRTEHKVETTHKIEAHIVLDVRQIQSEAAQLESEVREEPKPKAKPDGGESTSMIGIARETRAVASRRSFWSIFDVSTAAWAVDKAEVDAAKERRKKRGSALVSALDTGCLGENNRGMVEMRPCDANDDRKKEIRELMQAENEDRRIIYLDLAERQGHGEEAIDEVGRAWAVEIRKRLDAGQAFQVPGQQGYYEDFLDSDLGKKVTEKYGKPGKGDWVRVP